LVLMRGIEFQDVDAAGEEGRMVVRIEEVVAEHCDDVVDAIAVRPEPDANGLHGSLPADLTYHSDKSIEQTSIGRLPRRQALRLRAAIQRISRPKATPPAIQSTILGSTVSHAPLSRNICSENI